MLFVWFFTVRNHVEGASLPSCFWGGVIMQETAGLSLNRSVEK